MRVTIGSPRAPRTATGPLVDGFAVARSARRHRRTVRQASDPGRFGLDAGTASGAAARPLISMGLVGVFGDGLRFATRWYTSELQFR
jgi:hypothetical protein